MSRVLEWWRSLGATARVIVVVVAGAVAVNVAVEALDEVTGGSEPGGPTSSSYATAPDGLAAYAELLARSGHDVERVRRPLHETALPAGATLLVADAALSADDTAAIASWLPTGGRLVVTGPSAAAIVSATGAGELTWTPDSTPVAVPIVPLSDLDAVATVTTGAEGGWSGTGVLLPVVSGPRSHLLAAGVHLGGRVLALADTSPLQNRLLASADNAALGLALAGEPGAPVLFAEEPHGFGTGTGVAALPADWRWAGALAALAALAWMWSRGRRLGPPQRAGRDLPPPRRAYVDALAATLAKSRRPHEAVDPVRARARAALARRAGAGPEPDDAVLAHTATAIGMTDDEVAAVLGRVPGDDGVLAAGRALARLEGGTGSWRSTVPETATPEREGAHP